MPSKKVNGYNFPIKNISYVDKPEVCLGTGVAGKVCM